MEKLEQAIAILKGSVDDPWVNGCDCDKCVAFAVVLSAAESYLASQQASKPMGVVEYEEYLRNRAAQEGKT